MKLELVRDTFTNKSTTGKLFIDDIFECFVLEDVIRDEKVYGKTAIPEGEYELTIDYSPKYDRPMMHILSVPNFEGIRIHAGNVAEDTEGCLLVGRIRRANWVGESKLALAPLFQKVKEAVNNHEKITIEITSD
jgi:hypothetical protein